MVIIRTRAKIKVKSSQLVHKIEREQTDGRTRPIALAFLANAVGKIFTEPTDSTTAQSINIVFWLHY